MQILSFIRFGHKVHKLVIYLHWKSDTNESLALPSLVATRNVSHQQQLQTAVTLKVHNSRQQFTCEVF